MNAAMHMLRKNHSPVLFRLSFSSEHPLLQKFACIIFSISVYCSAKWKKSKECEKALRVCVCLCLSGAFSLPPSNSLRPFWHISKYKYTTRCSAQSFLPFKSLKCALTLCAESSEAPDSQVRLPSPNTVLVHLPSASSHSYRWVHRTPPSPLCVCVDSADNQVVPRCPWITAR